MRKGEGYFKDSSTFLGKEMNKGEGHLQHDALFQRYVDFQIFWVRLAIFDPYN